MSVPVLPQAKQLSEVPAGSVFGSYVGDIYSRFFRLPDISQVDRIPVVSLGPEFGGLQDGAEQGPTIFLFESDEYVVLESDTFIYPKITTSDSKRINPLMPGYFPLGAMVLAGDGKILLNCRSGHGKRALVNIETGVASGTERTVAYYRNYVLIASDELGEKRIIFDSSLATKPIAMATI